MITRLPLALAAAIAAASAFGLAEPAAAAYPEKPITLIVPAGTGGGMDVAGRLLATALEAKLGQRILIVNKPAGAGIGGLEDALQLPADGYTLTIVGNDTASRPLFAGDSKPFDMSRVAYIGRFGYIPRLIVAEADAPYKTFDEMLKWAADHPGKLIYGEGARTDLAQVQILAKKANAKINYVWFNSGGEIALAQMGKHVHASGIGTPTAAMELVFSGRLRPLAALGANPVPGFPDLPPITKFGAARAVDGEYGFVVKAGTDEAIVRKLESTLKEVLADPTVIKALEAARYVPSFMPGKEWGEKAKIDVEASLAVFRESEQP